MFVLTSSILYNERPQIIALFSPSGHVTCIYDALTMKIEIASFRCQLAKSSDLMVHYVIGYFVYSTCYGEKYHNQNKA